VQNEFPTIKLFQPVIDRKVYTIEEMEYVTNEITTILMQIENYSSIIDNEIAEMPT